MMNWKPPYIFCGDDFTGSSDTLATLSRAGLNCRLFPDVESLLGGREAEEFDAVGIATATRSLPPEGISAVLRPIAGLLKKMQPEVFHYKVCSTFDSSPATGNIATAINTIHSALPESRVLIAGGQPSLQRYCSFSNLFAAATDGAVHRLDRHPTMAHHPVTPMTDADLREVLAGQGLEAIGFIHFPSYRKGLGHVLRQLHDLWQRDEPVLFDVQSIADIRIIGEILQQPHPGPLVAVGSSSIAEAYLSGRKGNTGVSSSRVPTGPQKPLLVVAGSRSQMTATQVQQSSNFALVDISPLKIEANKEQFIDQLGKDCLTKLDAGKAVLAVVGTEMNHSLSKADIAEFTAELIARIAVSGAIDRLCIAGGDTSSLALQRLKPQSLSFLADIEPGLCLCRLHMPAECGISSLDVVLKGGQMGSAQLFNKLQGPI